MCVCVHSMHHTTCTPYIPTCMHLHCHTCPHVHKTYTTTIAQVYNPPPPHPPPPHTHTYIHTQGSADPLNSAFHLTYNMVLNLLRVEEINPEYMLERSFYQFQNNSAIPSLEQSTPIHIAIPLLSAFPSLPFSDFWITLDIKTFHSRVANQIRYAPIQVPL